MGDHEISSQNGRVGAYDLAFCYYIHSKAATETYSIKVDVLSFAVKILEKYL